MSIIFGPTKNILATCDLVDEGIKTYLRSVNDEHLGRYESQVECLLNITHSVRIFESVLELARKDLVNIQSALILSRGLFEVLLKVAWILYPPDVFECEARYTSHLRTEIDYLGRSIKQNEKLGFSTDTLKKQLEPLKIFNNDLTELLKDKGYIIPKLPNIREILKSFGEERKYGQYMLLCQYTHLSHYAGKMYRKNLGVYKELSEEVQLDDWKLVFAVCWPVFEFATEFYIFRAQRQESIYSSEFKEKIRSAFLSIF